MDSGIVQAAIAEARETGTPVAELSLDQIARRAGGVAVMDPANSASH